MKLITKIALLLCLIVLGTSTKAQWVPTNVQGSWEDMHCIDTNTCYVVGTLGNIKKTTNGGQMWELANTGVSGNIHCMNVYCTDANTCYVAMTDNTVLKTINGGQSWQTYYMVDYVFDKMIFTDANTGYGYLSASSGTPISITEDGGDNWNFVSSVNVKLRIKKIAFADSDNAFAVVDSITSAPNNNFAQIYRSTDKCKTWEKLYQFEEDSTEFYDISFINSEKGYVTGSGGTFLETTNGGLSWSKKDLNTNNSLFSVSFSNEFTGCVVGSMKTVRKTIDGGITWEEQSVSDEPTKVVFPHKDKGFILTWTNVFSNSDKGDTITSITNLKSKQVLGKIYPNPSTGKINISITENFLEQIIFVMYDITGKPVMQTSLNSTETNLNCEDFPAGVYFYNLKSQNQVVSAGKLIKN